MKDIAGAALIARKIAVNCMKYMIKPSTKTNMFLGSFIYSLREAEAKILLQISDEDILRISGQKGFENVGLTIGGRISGKSLYLHSDRAITKVKIGVSDVVSGRHKRQYLELKSKIRCVAFVLSTWKGETIEPPEPMYYLSTLYRTSEYV